MRVMSVMRIKFCCRSNRYRWVRSLGEGGSDANGESGTGGREALRISMEVAFALRHDIRDALEIVGCLHSPCHPLESHCRRHGVLRIE
jgi:hypothetical protein